jgi:branched-chain amino acid transport system permease protein
LLGLVPLLGWAGIPFLAPYALAGFGAYLTWRLRADVPGIVALAIAAAGTAVVGILAALPALRLRGLYLALGSIAFALIAVNVIFTQPEIFGDPRQLNRPFLFWVDLHSPRGFLVFAAVVYSMLALALVALRRSPLGRRVVATRDSEAAAACLGINPVREKVIVFAIAGAISGIGGGVLALGQRFVSTEQFPMIGGLAIILSLTIWGIGTAAGPVVAGLTAATLIAISQDWATGNWTRALQLVGPALAALALVNHPRGQIPEMSERTRKAPWGTVARLGGAAIGAVAGVRLHLPGLVGLILAISLYITGDVLYRLLVQYRRGVVPSAGAPSNDIDAPELGLAQPFTPSAVRKLDRALGMSESLGRSAP